MTMKQLPSSVAALLRADPPAPSKSNLPLVRVSTDPDDQDAVNKRQAARLVVTVDGATCNMVETASEIDGYVITVGRRGTRTMQAGHTVRVHGLSRAERLALADRAAHRAR